MISTRKVLRSADGQCSGALLRPDPAPPPGATWPLLACIPGGGCSGRYFELAKHSTAATALERGFAVLLVDRPGYGASDPIGGHRPIRSSVTHIASLIWTALKEPDIADELVIIGHSIGAAVALLLAAQADDLPLRAVAVSGLGDEPPPMTRRWAEDALGAANRPDLSAQMFFGPPGTYDWRGPAALRRAAEPWRMTEVVEIVNDWPDLWPRLAPAITCPAHLRLSDTDNIWVADEAVVQRMAVRLTASPLVDAELLANGGHAYEFHLRGPDLVADQLRFLGEYVTGAT